MYTLSGVVKKYRKGAAVFTALQGVDLDVADGEWLAIRGPTGHGKSTLLQILGGLDRPTAGTAEFDGMDLGTMPERQVTKVRARSFGFIFQTFNLIPTLSAVENVETALVPLGAAAADKKSRAEQALAAVGLGERLRHLPSGCPGASSSGWRSQERWSRSRRCCSPTSRRATSTREPGTRSSACWRSSGTPAGRRWCSSPTTAAWRPERSGLG
jgi:predicted ABC-type transport system involved in lysophospholipase L1 biosynthesis ATPase subunit